MRSKRRVLILLTCEHGGNLIPKDYQALFVGHHKTLATHRGWDIGALRIATMLHKSLNVPLFSTEISRLLIDCNRSLHHKGVFSEFSRTLPLTEKIRIIKRYYTPHREKIERWIDKKIKAGYRVLHIGVHSFTPVLNGKTRHADVGLLYDFNRAIELNTALEWQKKILDQDPKLKIKRNYPYYGHTDGLVTALRKKFLRKDYLGFELELNQKMIGQTAAQAKMAKQLSASIKKLLACLVWN